MKIFIASRRRHYQIKRCLNKKLCTCFLPIFTDGTSSCWLHVGNPGLHVVFQSAFLIYDKCNFCCAKCHFSWIETNIIGEGGGRRAKYKKYIYSRKGKLNEKNLCTLINPKKYSCYDLKLKLMKEFDNEKNFRGTKIPHPPPPITLLMVRP